MKISHIQKLKVVDQMNDDITVVQIFNVVFFFPLYSKGSSYPYMYTYFFPQHALLYILNCHFLGLEAKNFIYIYKNYKYINIYNIKNIHIKPP